MTKDLLQATLKFSQGNKGRGVTGKRRGSGNLASLENIYWFNEFAEHIKVL